MKNKILFTVTGMSFITMILASSNIVLEDNSISLISLIIALLCATEVLLFSSINKDYFERIGE